ncbi:MAG: hypothetical protein A2722_01280 [Candidatus Doudnabacteria bacterium RIFCSPHIGHO2_01_FULL_50_11]|uniref:EamA domain-containing protein n=1 Tax=Candidatus Doudnabacteria bacterium RIFCSPHIGHO2_01_FULL_50_11 TaxID=1817828 RepID=A0A1F5PH56_9BACT|nr:MAG: hypothetical protein A2722_01280 [Candidatus Doudnabacteria bacterium RIFCSPHIGHO2_01_FULL_50_11]HLC44970.1 EamA family transporter [Patescibacteria group bacterium]
MKSIFYALTGTIMYAVTGVVIDLKLDKFSTVALELLFILPMLPIALIWLATQRATGQQVLYPLGTALWITMGLGVVYFFADYFYLGAFTSGGDVMTISSIILIVPAVAALIKFLWVGGYPNMYQIAGYVLIAIAMVLITKGSQG